VKPPGIDQTIELSIKKDTKGSQGTCSTLTNTQSAELGASLPHHKEEGKESWYLMVSG